LDLQGFPADVELERREASKCQRRVSGPAFKVRQSGATPGSSVLGLAQPPLIRKRRADLLTNAATVPAQKTRP
jgi:hypothetical protein